MCNKQVLKDVLEIQKILRAVAPLKDAQFIARYIGSVGHEDRQPDEQSRLKFLGLTMPQVRALEKTKFSFSHLSAKEQLSRWLELYHSSDIHEELTLALTWLSRRKSLILEQPELVFALQNRVDNWAHSDGVSDFIAHLIEHDPKTHLPQLQKWNQSKNPWERRQSLVGLYFYARFRKNPLPVKNSLPLIKNLLDDPHYFVQKGLGWSLREIHQIDPVAQKKFLLKHLDRLSAQAFVTAIEKFPATEREKMKRLRAQLRRNRL